MAATDQASQPANADASPPAKPKSGKLRAGLLMVLAVVIVIVLIFGVIWWTHGRFVQETNDAYVRADQVTVAPKISGYVTQVYVTDNQSVAAGQPLVRIDPASYEATLASQAAAIEGRQADVVAAQSQIEQQKSAIAESAAQLKGAQDAAAYADREAERYRGLASQGVETQQRYAQAINERDQARAKLRSAQAAQAQATAQAATLQAQLLQAQAQLKSAQAQAQSAKINVDDSLLRASIAGRIGDKSVRVGQFVQPGTRLMSVVPVQDIYLVANFKETQIGQMKVGQKATVKIDAFGGRKIDAVLDSFSPGTGSQFALLPAENATGNFTKIVQRVPVRFHLLPPADLKNSILPGLSATVSVDTSQITGQTAKTGPSS